MIPQHSGSRLLAGGLLVSVLGFFTVCDASQELTDAKAEMETVYNRVLESIRSAGARSAFVDAQSAWTSYRDRSVDFLRAHSPAAETWEQLELDLTRKRTATLRGLLNTGFASVHDWPMFGGSPSRNAVVPDAFGPVWWQVKGAVDDEDEEFEEDIGIRWAAKVGQWCTTQPVVSGNLVWVGTNGFSDNNGQELAWALICFDSRTGRELYRHGPGQNEKPFDYPFRMPMGCTPLIEDDLIWFTTKRLETVCLNIGPLRRGEGDPQLVWKVDLVERFNVFPHDEIMGGVRTSIPATHKDLLFVVTNNGTDWSHQNIPSPEAPSLVCLDKHTGKLIWEDATPGKNIFDGQWSTPLVATVGDDVQIIVGQGDGWIRAFAPHGDGKGGSKILWEFNLNPEEARGKFGVPDGPNNILAAPVLYKGLVYIGSGQPREHGDGSGRLCCLDPAKKGELVWDLNGWANKNFRRTMSNVAIANDLVIACDYAGYVRCVDALTGEGYWEYRSQSHILGSPLIVGDRVYVANEDGEVLVFGLSRDPASAMIERDGSHHPLHRIYMDGPIYASPVFAGGTLYVATASMLYAIAAPGNENTKGQAENTGRDQRPPGGPRSPFVPTPTEVVSRMLELAGVKGSDRLYDLGSGDGRILITGAEQYGCTAIGYEIDGNLVKISRDRIREAGLESRVTVNKEDLFEVDLTDADVITVFLYPNQLELLKPHFAKLKPGARVVAHHFAIPGVKPDEKVKVALEDGSYRDVYLWNAPLSIAENDER